jgi:hypothetical protein
MLVYGLPNQVPSKLEGLQTTDLYIGALVLGW